MGSNEDSMWNVDMHRWTLRRSWGLKAVIVTISGAVFGYDEYNSAAIMEGESILIVVPSNTHWIGDFMGKSWKICGFWSTFPHPKTPKPLKTPRLGATDEACGGVPGKSRNSLYIYLIIHCLIIYWLVV